MSFNFSMPSLASSVELMYLERESVVAFNVGAKVFFKRGFDIRNTFTSKGTQTSWSYFATMCMAFLCPT